MLRQVYSEAFDLSVKLRADLFVKMSRPLHGGIQHRQPNIYFSHQQRAFRCNCASVVKRLYNTYTLYPPLYWGLGDYTPCGLIHNLSLHRCDMPSFRADLFASWRTPTNIYNNQDVTDFTTNSLNRFVHEQSSEAITRMSYTKSPINARREVCPQYLKRSDSNG